jgi:ribosomal protein L29
LVKLRTSVKSGGNVDNVGRIREIRRTIARLLTVENQPAAMEAKA